MLSQQALGTHAQLREIDRALFALQRTDGIRAFICSLPRAALPLGSSHPSRNVGSPRRQARPSDRRWSGARLSVRARYQPISSGRRNVNPV